MFCWKAAAYPDGAGHGVLRVLPSPLREAWAEFGAEFMATWEPSEQYPLPWAAEAFGLPEEAA